jgi:hypothetical protein
MSADEIVDFVLDELTAALHPTTTASTERETEST